MAYAEGEAVAGLRVRLLGGLDVEGMEQHRVGSRKARRLLEVLALARGTPVPVDRLVDALWGARPPERPGDQVGVLVSRLRGVLGADRLVRTDAGYALRADWLDIVELGERAAEAAARLQAGAHGAARVAAGAALALARGPLVPEEDAPWADSERAAVDRVVAGVRLVAAEAALRAGDQGGAATAGEAALDHDPYDEVALRIVMRAHTQAGRPASALAVYARVRERLADDLGVSPAPETEALHRSILMGESTSAPSPVPGSSLVGRAAELDRLDAQLGRAALGAAVAVVVEGEAGIGKTALVDRFAAGAEAAGRAVVLAGRCDALGRELPLQPLLDGLAAHLRAIGPEAATTALGPEGAVVAPLLGLSGLAGAATPRPPGAAPSGAGRLPVPTVVPDAGAAQALLFAGLLAVVERVGGGQPVMLVVDDLHHAGASTLEWLRMALRRGQRLLVVAMGRPPAGAALAGAEVIGLGPLDLAATRALVGDERAAELHARSGGHPLLLRELAAAGAGALPDGIREAARARAAELGPAERTLLAAAVLGPAVDLDLLAGVLGEPAARLLDHLEAAVGSGMLEERSGEFAFSHELVREALAAGAGSVRRAFLHREAARALAGRPGHDPLAAAWHARQGGDRVLAAAGLVAGAEVAAGRYDLAEAERLCSEAVDLADGVEARLARGRVRLARSEYAAAGDDTTAALAAGGGPEAFELAGWVAYYRRDLAAALRLADEGRQRAEDDGLRASCLVLAGRARHSRGDLALADGHLTEALGAAPASVRQVAQVWLGALRTHQGRPLEALDLVDRGLAAGGRLGHPFAPFHGLFARAHALGLAGRVEAAAGAVDAFDAAVRAGGEAARRFRPVVANMGAWLARLTGDPAAADDRNHEALAEAAGVAFDEPRGHALLDLADGRLRAGDATGAERFLAAGEDVVGGDGTMAWRQRERLGLLRARLALSAGDPEAAGVLAGDVAAQAAGRGCRRYEVLGRLLTARAAARRGEPVDLEAVGGMLSELDGLAGLDAWEITAEVARDLGVSRWADDAERRAGRLVAGAGVAAPRLAGYVERRLGELR